MTVKLMEYVANSRTRLPLMGTNEISVKYQGGLRIKKKYCTISIDSAWGVTCDQMDEILTTSNLGVTWDMV